MDGFCEGERWRRSEVVSLEVEVGNLQSLAVGCSGVVGYSAREIVLGWRQWISVKVSEQVTGGHKRSLEDRNGEVLAELCT